MLALLVVQMVCVSQAHAAAVSKQATNLGLVGYWSFNEGTSTKAHDFSGNRNDGTFFSSPLWTAGKMGSALSFNGAYVTTPTINHNIGTGDFTYSAWVRLLPGSSHTGGATLWGVVANDDYSPVMAIGDGTSLPLGNLAMYWGGWFDFGSTISLTRWAHITMVRRTGVITGYVNGIAAPNTSSNSNSMSNAQFVIGRSGVTYTADPFPGTIDEVRVYNRALTNAEISTLYQSGGAKVATTNSSSGTPLVVKTENNKLTKGLVGLWSLNTVDISGTTAIDRSGQGNNGTITNAPSTIAGKVDKALSFNGSTQYVTIPDATSLKPDSITLSVWVYPTTLCAFRRAVIEKWYLSGVWGYGIETCADAGNFISFVFRNTADGVDRTVSSGITATPNRWYFVTATYDARTGLAKIYVNGVLSGTLQDTANPLMKTTKPVVIGASDDDASVKYFFPGYIDEARIYNRPLSESEVKELYQLGTLVVNASQTNRSTSGLVGYWNFDGKNTNFATKVTTDSSGTGNNGTLTAMSTTTSPIAGRVGQALSFDGVDDIVSVPNNSSLNFGAGNFSISVWSKINSTQGSGQGNGYVRLVDKTFTTGYSLGLSSSGNIHLEINGNGSAVDTSGHDYRDNLWHNIVAVRTGNTTASIYVDGVLSVSGTIVGGTMTSTSALGIGSEFDGSTRYLKGAIDEVRIYNRALTAAEAKQLYLMGK